MNGSKHAHNGKPSPAGETPRFGEGRLHLLGLIVIIALSAVVYLYRFGHSPQLGISNDDARYLVLAEGFATGHPYRVVSYPDAPPETVWPPGYPLLLAPFWLLVGPNYDVLRFLSLLLSLASIVLVDLALRPWIPNWRLRLVSVALFAFNPKTGAFSSVARAEAPFIFLSLCHIIAMNWWLRKPANKSHVGLILASVSLAAAVLVRYQGIALAAASFVLLVLHKRMRDALQLALLTGLLFVPFLALLVTNGIDSPTSVFAVSATTSRVSDLAQNISGTFANYWRSIPIVLVPALGPRAAELLAPSGLAWLIDLIHTFLLLPCLVGVVLGIRRRELGALYVVFYFALVVVITNPSFGVIHDEPRYVTAVLPFLYAYAVIGFDQVIQRLPSQVSSRTRTLASMSVVALLLGLLLWRNYQQSHVQFPVADLSAGAQWVQDHTSDDAIFMTHDPVSRYVHLRRNTVDFPYLSSPEGLTGAIFDSRADYVLISPPLVLDKVANTAQAMSPFVQLQVLPLLQESPDDFLLVYEDVDRRTWIYRINRSGASTTGFGDP